MHVHCMTKQEIIKSIFFLILQFLHYIYHTEIKQKMFVVECICIAAAR